MIKIETQEYDYKGGLHDGEYGVHVKMTASDGRSQYTSYLSLDDALSDILEFAGVEFELTELEPDCN